VILQSRECIEHKGEIRAEARRHRTSAEILTGAERIYCRTPTEI
jgi:hypothetical protein